MFFSLWTVLSKLSTCIRMYKINSQKLIRRFALLFYFPVGRKKQKAISFHNSQC